MIHDESEPSLFRYFENNLSSNSSTSSFTTSDEEKHTNLERRTSISLYNVSSTPHVFKPLKKCRFRYDIDSDNECKPKRKKYDHIESKVKQYRNEIREQSEYRRSLRLQQDDQIRKDLENNLRVSDQYDLKNHSLKYVPNVTTNEDLKNNLLYLSPIVNSNEENNFIEPAELKEKYNEALSEIENLQMEISKLKLTPGLSRRKSFQSSMIKTCLFKNSSTTNRQNILQNSTTRSTFFGGDSTCRTIDIDDLISPNKNRINPFIRTSSIAESVTNSSVPLLFDDKPRNRNKVYTFFNNFIKCPTVGFLCKLNYKKRNKVAPMPHVVISSPSIHEKNFTESFEFVRKPNFDEDHLILDSLSQELFLKEMSDCCEELKEKIDCFKKLVNDCLIKNINNNNS